MRMHSSLAFALSICLLACASGDLNVESDVAVVNDTRGGDTPNRRPGLDTGDVGEASDTPRRDIPVSDLGLDLSDDSGVPTPDATPDSVDPPTSAVVPLVIPTDPSALHIDSLDVDSFIADVPLPDCSAPSGQMVPANRYRINNSGAEGVSISVSLRTRAEDPSLGLPDGAVFLYDEAALETMGSMCLLSGRPVEGYASQVADITVPAFGAIGILVAARSPGATGTFALTIHRGEATPPEELPDPEMICDDSCGHARNLICNDGGEGSLNSDCAYGTDCSDCGERLPEG